MKKIDIHRVCGCVKERKQEKKESFYLLTTVGHLVEALGCASTSNIFSTLS